MKKTLLAVFLLIFAALAIAQDAAKPDQQPEAAPPITAQVEVFFSPKGGCTEAVVKQINAAQNTIHVQAYSFTSKPVSAALLKAHKRGVVVRVILDSDQRTAKYSEADFLHNVGIETYIDAQHAIAHNKVMIFDGETVITGSFNFTKQAEERNAENLLVIRSKELAEKYEHKWRLHFEHAEKYERISNRNEESSKG